MNPQELLKYFDRISEAPDAIPRLRLFILDLAVRGKLVEQDPNDEPASELLKRILKLHNNPKIIDSSVHEPLYNLPLSWTWVILEQIAHLEMGQSPPSEHYNQSKLGLPFYQGKSDFGKRHPTPRYWCTQPTKIAYKGDILISVRAPVGPTNVANEESCIGRGLSALRPYQGVELEYLLLTLKCFESALASLGFGTTFVAVTKKQLISFRLPLPPLAEQHRIVAKVDELMTLCDKLETARKERENRREKLVKATLIKVSSAEESIIDTRFFLDNIPHITIRPEHIKPLRQTILDLAVRGKLVPQDPTDEPASELLKRIRNEKKSLIQQGLIGKEKILSSINPNDHPFSVHDNWIWVKIGDCSLLIEYGTSAKSNYCESGVPVLTMGNIQNGKVKLGKQKTVPLLIDDLPRLFLKNLDLLYNRTNSAELVGKTGIFLGEDNAYTFASYLIRIRFSLKLVDPIFINIAMNSSYFRETQIIPELKQQCGQANVNGTKLRNMIIPLPPLAEQHRIVAKVDELMALCDKLETQLNHLQTDNQRLLQAVLQRALS